MIAKISVYIVLGIVLSTLYFEWQHWRGMKWYKQVLCWLPSVFAIACTLQMAREEDFIPDDIQVLVNYLTLLCVFVVPLFLVALCGVIGVWRKKRKTGERVGWVLSLVAIVTYLYGTFVGFGQFEVKRVEMFFDDLPEAFDGYKIVQFSDAHVGTLVGSREYILKRAIDSINAQKADIVVFTGDLQNKKPNEIERHADLLGSIQSRDGIFSVLGNHDYCEYIGCKDPFVIGANMGLTRSLQEDMGWTLLTNGHRRIRRDSACIVIAGMENDGEGRFPQLGNINATLAGVSRDEFVVMLEHDPTAWHRKILPHSHAQLTLSGHTHGGQIMLFGWSPADWVYTEPEGLYHVGNRIIYVSKGIGGVVPFRLGDPGEIVVITLRKK